MKLGLALIVTLVLVASHVGVSQGSPRMGTAPVEPSLREAPPATEIFLSKQPPIAMRGASERKLRGASERKLRGASERKLRGASERKLRGASERKLRGASERKLRGN